MPHATLEERQHQLVAAAIKVMYREGVPKLTTRRVAEEADVPLSIVHYCFKNKQEMVRAAVCAVTEEYIVAAEALAETGETLEEGLRLTLRAFWDLVRRDWEKQVLPYEITLWALREDKMRSVADEQYGGYYTAIERSFRHYAEFHGLRYTVPLDVIMRLFMAAVDGLTLGLLVDGDYALVDRTGDLLAALISSMTVKQPRTRSPAARARKPATSRRPAKPRR